MSGGAFSMPYGSVCFASHEFSALWASPLIRLLSARLKTPTVDYFGTRAWRSLSAAGLLKRRSIRMPLGVAPLP